MLPTHFMATRFKNWGSGAVAYRTFVMQKLLIEKHFPLFRCRFANRRLICMGNITPTEGCATYSIEIRYLCGGIPEVRIISPRIQWNKDIHMYRNGTLCLYYPPESPWKPTSNLHQTIIPWAAEWLVFYELFLLKGLWLGKAAPHGLPLN